MIPGLAAELRDGVLCIRAYGVWSVYGESAADQSMALSRAEKAVGVYDYHTLALEAGELERWDSSLLAVLARLIVTARDRQRTVDTSSLPEGMARLLTRIARTPIGPAAVRPKRGKDEGLLESIGGKAMTWPAIALDVIHFLGATVVSLIRFFTGRSAVSKRDLWGILRECGADALPIVSLTSLLLGLILAFVSSIQLRDFGAELYTAALVCVAMLRVMGPVLTGIVLAGRTGASFAAIIGSMQVNEEVDALVTFGIDPMDFLVLPRVLALAVMTPLLTVYADVMGIAGGFLVGVAMMDIAPAAYLDGTIQSLDAGYFGIGLFHALVFGLIVSLCGCRQGMKSGRSAEAVGQAATAAVVNALVGIIVSTSIITIVLTVIDL